MVLSESRRLGEVIRIPESSNNLLKAISLILSRWSGLQMAVRNQWGGQDSLSKSHQLAIDIFFWFTDHSKCTYFIYLKFHSLYMYNSYNYLFFKIKLRSYKFFP